MTTDSLLTWLAWALAVVGAAAVVLALVVARKTVSRILVIAVAALVFLLVLAVRLQIASIADDEPRLLCAGGVSWFGLQLSGSDRLCADYR